MLPVTLGLGLINVNLAGRHDLRPLVDRRRRRAPSTPRSASTCCRRASSRSRSRPCCSRPSRGSPPRGDIDGLPPHRRRRPAQIHFLLLPASAFSAVLAEPIVRLLYQRGAFDAEPDATLVAQCLAAFSLGLAVQRRQLLLIRAFFSLQRPWMPTTPRRWRTWSLNGVLDWLLYKPLGVWGIPLATVDRRTSSTVRAVARACAARSGRARGPPDGAAPSRMMLACCVPLAARPTASGG